MQIPPEGGSSFNMVFKMLVAGVIGYPAKKLQPASHAALAITSFPSRKDIAMGASLKTRIFAICCGLRQIMDKAQYGEKMVFCQYNIGI
jgi:hypothetical protein